MTLDIITQTILCDAFIVSKCFWQRHTQYLYCY